MKPSCDRHLFASHFLAILFLGIGCGGYSIDAEAQTADRIFFNGTVITVNDTAPRANAVAVKDGKIIAVGSQAEVFHTKGSQTQLTDLTGLIIKTETT